MKKSAVPKTLSLDPPEEKALRRTLAEVIDQVEEAAIRLRDLEPGFPLPPAIPAWRFAYAVAGGTLQFCLAAGSGVEGLTPQTRRLAFRMCNALQGLGEAFNRFQYSHN